MTEKKPVICDSDEQAHEHGIMSSALNVQGTLKKCRLKVFLEAALICINHFDLNSIEIYLVDVYNIQNPPFY